MVYGRRCHGRSWFIFGNTYEEAVFACLEISMILPMPFACQFLQTWSACTNIVDVEPGFNAAMDPQTLWARLPGHGNV